jgi:hypothetical protein
MPRGQNLRRDSPQRAADDAKIRDRWLKRNAQLPPQPEPAENPDMAMEAERENISFEFRRLRSQHWEKPALVGGKLVARELPAEMVLPWEEYTSVVARERPDYSDWRLETRPYGTVLLGPNRLPELLSNN